MESAADRIVAAMEFQAQYLPPHDAKPPENLEFSLQPTWEIAFNHCHIGSVGPFRAWRK